MTTQCYKQEDSKHHDTETYRCKSHQPFRSCFISNRPLLSLFFVRAYNDAERPMATENEGDNLSFWIYFNHQPWLANRIMCQQYWYDKYQIVCLDMGCNLWQKIFGYMQFLMNKSSRELIGLFTNYRYSALCINLLLQSCFRNLTRVKGLCFCHVWLCTGTPLFPCFDVFIVD